MAKDEKDGENAFEKVEKLEAENAQLSAEIAKAHSDDHPADVEAPPAPLSFFQTLKTYPRSFWMGCIIEMFERLAWYGNRVVLPIYICQADEPGGLHFTQAQKSSIYGTFAFVAATVPMISGGLADRYGYKTLIRIYVALNILAYVLMANVRSYPGFFASYLIVAVANSLFKPAIQGTLAQSMDKRTSSVGWGLFYWVVNVGGAVGPPFAGLLHIMGWSYVFYGCAAITLLNFFLLWTYPNVESGAEKKPLFDVLKNTILNLADRRLLAIVIIFSGFWTMLYQLWDFMPNFYADWVDSSGFVKAIGGLPSFLTQETARGVMLKQENALNLNSVMIVCFVIAASYLVRKMRVLTAMTMGFVIATFGNVMFGLSTSVYFVFLGIMLFSLGEMLTGPKKTEYFALIAPPGKKALYLGYVNIPVALGQVFGATIVAKWYGNYGEKAVLALKYLATKTDRHGPGTWDGQTSTLEAFVGVPRKAAATTLGEVLQKDAPTINDLLWNEYQPYRIWFIFAAVGFVSLLAMLAYARQSRKWKEMDV